MYNIYFRYLFRIHQISNYFISLILNYKIVSKQLIYIHLSKMKIIFHLFKNDIFNRIAKNLILLGYNAIKGNDLNDIILYYNRNNFVLMLLINDNFLLSVSVKG